MHKQLALAILVFYILLLSILSLISVSGIPTLGSSIDDKIYHFIAYSILTILCYNFFSSTTLKRKIFISVSVAVIYGIIIEALQSRFTDYRIADIYDVIANVLGAIFGVIIIRLYRNIKLK